jgi:pilus assembly protein CpaB
MRPIVVVLIVLALGAAVIAAYLANQWVRSQQAPTPAQTAQQSVDTDNVLVAARDITPGTILKPDDLRWQAWPSSGIDQDRMIVQPKPGVETQQPAQDPQQDFLEHIARRQIMSGEPMSKEMVIKQGDGSVAAANITPGSRAVTINVAPNQGVAGLVLPNDHVDIIMNTPVRDLTGIQGWKDVVLRFTSETILKDIRVVAINQTLSHDPTKGVAEPGNLVTLEVTPAQAEKLLIAQQLGQLTLSLRSLVTPPNDNKEPTYTFDVRASKALSSLVALDLDEEETDLPQTASDAQRMAKERAKRKTQVTINRGGTVAIQKFGQ